ncbi:GNAT family N-acetyltransferase [Jatrophihabitans endophyticus]|uniref:GNAT family N-acetyltransferase n=1 Tax=Jatrophihabitans endophyticus TaxID=1206085 RepID=UPI001A0C846D|nr:GNAT family N-acetyltransferase [Jatrophihabitans endophyticus]MBE7187316.1 GNAT family N-acetyltransferase [Jatrophihabitans endophyticus]
MSADLRVRDGVRRLVTADAGELLTLQLAAWVAEAHANATLAIPALHESVDDVRAQLDDPAWRIWGLVDDRRLLATVRTRLEGPDSAYVGRLAVVPDLRGCGLGSAMLRWAEADLPGDVRTVELVTGIRSTANHAFYRRHGYDQVGTDDEVGTALFRKRRGEAPQATWS